jgi:hypothetical protein
MLCGSNDLEALVFRERATQLRDLPVCVPDLHQVTGRQDPTFSVRIQHRQGL